MRSSWPPPSVRNDRPVHRLEKVPAFKPAYLIHGDDHGRISERRARLRALAESLSGAEGVEVFEGDAAAPDAVAAALDSMTLVLGRRFIIVDGVEGWKDKDLDRLDLALSAIAPETTVAFFAREDNRNKAPERLRELVRTVEGDVDSQDAVKPWELPKWVIANAATRGDRARRRCRPGADPTRRGAPAAAVARAGEDLPGRGCGGNGVARR